MLHFDVAYYDEEHAALLRETRLVAQLDAIVRSGLQITEEEFLVYSIFREQKKKRGFRTFGELRRKLPSRRRIFLDYFSLKNGIVRSRHDNPHHHDRTQTEAAGVGASLAVVSKALKLTEADWERIDESSDKDLDFNIASTGSQFIEVEAKGTIRDPGRKKSAARLHIEQKKEAKREILRKTKPRRTDVLLGVIASFPYDQEGKALCHLLDPPMTAATDDPRKHKLLARLSFYWREVGIMTRSSFLVALSNRLQSLSSIENFDDLDGDPLLNGRGETIAEPAGIFRNRSILSDGTAFGEVIPVRNDDPKGEPKNLAYFYGLDSAILPLLIEQSLKPSWNTPRQFRGRFSGMPESSPDCFPSFKNRSESEMIVSGRFRSRVGARSTWLETSP